MVIGGLTRGAFAVRQRRYGAQGTDGETWEECGTRCVHHMFIILTGRSFVCRDPVGSLSLLSRERGCADTANCNANYALQHQKGRAVIPWFSSLV